MLLSNTLLFRGTTEEEAKAMLTCLGSVKKQYEKGDVVYHTGEVVESMGLVLEGCVTMEIDDIWGNKSILGRAEVGQLFAETYACIPGAPLLVNVVASEKSEILFLNTMRLLKTCSNVCEHHTQLIRNLLLILSQKNLGLSQRILHTSSKSIRGRLLSYLSQEVKKNGSAQFTIPFNRQQLADYLSVDRSALSKELSKMQKDGIVAYDRNTFRFYPEKGGHDLGGSLN